VRQGCINEFESLLGVFFTLNTDGALRRQNLSLFLRQNLAGQRYFARLERKHGKGKALSVLAHKLARAVYHMLTRQQAFDLQRFLSAP
jgi:hypothetical protein